MSAKLLRSLTDENQDLQKQIGCMNGIFQLFDRHNFLNGRRVNNHSHKRLPPGQNSNRATQPDSALQRATEKDRNKLVKEKERVSKESSKTSLSSSSCSSGFSSIDQYDKTASSFNQPIFPETPTRPMKKTNAPLQLSQQSPDIRYVVKDSIYREARALSVKTAGKEEAMVSTLVYIDSPRPLQPPKPVKPRASSLDDSFRVLAKHREASRNYQEEKDGHMLSSLKDAPRLSYDGRLSQYACKSTIKLKELPRLSLDSREGSIRGTNSETKSNFLVKDLQRRNGNSSKMLNQQQEPESSTRSSSVVAKLMGVEAFPQSTWTSENPSGIISSCRTDKSVPFSKSSRTDGNKQNQISGSPRKDPILARLKNAESVMRPTSASRFPTDPAPWRQPDGKGDSQQINFEYEEGTTKASNSLSVYGEIEQRLAKLEFKKSGKDLRALKQILQAMQKTKEALDTKREQASNFASQTSNSSSSHQTSNLASPRKLQNKDPISSTIKGSHSPKSYKSPAVIMKPVNLIRRTCDHASIIIPTESMSGLCKYGDTADGRKVDTRTAKDITSRSNHLKDHCSPPSRSTDKKTHAKTSKSTSALKVPGHIIGEKKTSSVTVSPRLQQRNFRLQQESPHTISSSKIISQCTRQPTGSNSPGRKLRLKSHSLQQCNDQLSKTSSDMRDLSHQGDTVSLQSKSNISSGSHIDTQVTSTNKSDKINTTFFQHYCQKQENPEGFGKDRLTVEPAIATLEQPSPVSVLDATFYRDESPSPVKKISNAFKDYEALNPNEAEWNPGDLAQLQKSRQPRFSADIDHKKLENIQHLVQNLQQINCTEEEPITNYIAHLQEGTNSDHRYISEILLASGLLRDLDSGSMTFELQVDGYPINHNLLLALERTKASKGILNDKQSDKRIVKSEAAENIQRLLIFDTVNEILARKLLLGGPPQQWFSPNKLAGRKTRGQQLLEELCSEVDQIQNNSLNRSLEEDDSLRSIKWEDLMHRSMDWTDCHSEIPGVVLDVERLIFKDLITEVLYSEGAGQYGRLGRPCRKLLSM